MVASTPATSSSASARPPIRVGSAGLTSPCMIAPFLHAHHLAKHLIADADAAALDDAAGIFLHEHRTVDRSARAVLAERAVLSDRLEHAVESLFEEHGFEIVGRLADLGGLRI